MTRYIDLYMQARRAFLQTEDAPQAGFLARNLLCHCSGMPFEQILRDQEQCAEEAVCLAMGRATARILKGEPLAYILQQWDFCGLRLYVDEHVLIPRDDTCALVQLALKQALFLGQGPRILDLCTGSGCIGLAIAVGVADARVTLADLYRDTLAVARQNVTRHHLSGRVSCVQADALQAPPAFLGKFDMIVSNPPYVTAAEMEELPKSVRDYEPHAALFGGADGLDFYRSIAQNYRTALKPGGYLCLEFGMGQGDAVCDILEENGFTVLERVEDYNKRERAVSARYGMED